MNYKMSEIFNKVLFVLIVVVFTNSNQLLSQINYPGSPLGELSNIDIPEHTFSYQNPQIAKSKDDFNFNDKSAFTFAHQFNVAFTPENSGIWVDEGDETKVWFLKISSPGAFSINLIFDRYKLPKGAKLFIYNEDMSEVLGAFTCQNNKKSGVLPTAPINGDKIIVEYQEPKDVEFKGELLIGAVNHDFVGINNLLSLKGGDFGDSGSCEENISCYDPYNQIDISRAVLKVVIAGQELCTATLINNTNNDGTPYAITAGHCFKLDNTANTSLIYFNYKTPHCAADFIEGTRSQTISNATARVFVKDLDIALIELSETPPAYYRPYYAGWTLDAAPQPPYIAIHHPEGDVKKISTSFKPVIDDSFVISANAPFAQYANFHWRVAEWVSGVTEGGSSGGGLFDKNYKFIGGLSGGEAYCGHPVNDYYYQFYKAWDLRPNTNEQFKTWLDPSNTGLQSVDGFDPYTDRKVERVSNREVSEEPVIERYNSEGYKSGHNTMGIKDYAECFEGIETAKLKGVYLMPGKSKSFSGQTVKVKVWQGNDGPENLIFVKDFVTLNELKMDKEIYIDFDDVSTPDEVEYVNVTGTFFIGYEINYSTTPIDSFAIYHSQIGNTKIKNTMYVNQNGTWQLASQVYGGSNRSLWIDILAEDVVWGDTVVIEPDKGNLLLFPNPVYSEEAFLDTQNNFVGKYNVYDLTGTMVYQGYINRIGNKIPLKVKNLSHGTYIIKFELEDGSTVTKKLVKLIQ